MTTFYCYCCNQASRKAFDRDTNPCACMTGDHDCRPDGFGAPEHDPAVMAAIQEQRVVGQEFGR